MDEGKGCGMGKPTTNSDQPKEEHADATNAHEVHRSPCRAPNPVDRLKDACLDHCDMYGITMNTVVFDYIDFLEYVVHSDGALGVEDLLDWQEEHGWPEEDE